MYKIVLFLLGLLFIFFGRRFIIMHWPYAKEIYYSGLALCVAMVVLFAYGMMKKK